MFIWPKLVEEKKSRVNGQVRVYEFWGKYSISVGNLTQSGGLVEQIWDKALKTINRDQLPAKQMLILGLGGGTAAKVAKRYWPQAQITGVDIDPVMIAMGEKYLGLTGITKVIDDAAEWIGMCRQKFDGILVDIYQGRDIPESVTGEKFMENLGKRLNRGGWIVFNRLKTKESKIKNEKFKQQLEKVFGSYQIINTPVNELLLVK